MNIDYNDLKRIMLHSGCAFIGMGEASGRDRHITALKQALTSPLLENKNITGAKGLLVSFNFSGELAMSEEKEVMNTVRPYISNSALVKIGKTYDENLNKDSLKVVIIATNFPKDFNNTNTSRKTVKTQESHRWSSIDLRKYIPAIMRQNQEVK